MGFTSIKVKTEDKRAFDRLRHEVALHFGDDLPQHELFHRILEQALRSKGQLVRRGPARDWSKLQFDLPDPTDATQELDRVVYGLDR